MFSYGSRKEVDRTAVKARESMQVARAIIDTDGDLNRAIDVARRAAAEASEFESAVEAYVAEKGRRQYA